VLTSKLAIGSPLGRGDPFAGSKIRFVGAATLAVLAVFVTPALLAIAGGLLIRGEAANRGGRFWTGAALMAVGVVWFVSAQLVALLA
jgi:hypothetical protein